MKKRDELACQSSCLNKAADDELVFVLLERDVASAATVRFWVNERIRLGKNTPADPQIREALAWADQAESSSIEPPLGVYLTNDRLQSLVAEAYVSGRADGRILKFEERGDFMRSAVTRIVSAVLSSGGVDPWQS